MPNHSDAHIRWMIRRDMPEVLAIEADCFDIPWSEDDFTAALRTRNTIGMVAEHDSEVVGFFLYELLKPRLHIIDFAVRRDARRHGVGRKMVGKLVGKLSRSRRRLHVAVRETNLDAQLFFRSCGFRAISVLHDHYEDTDEDAYLMQYLLRSAVGTPT